MAEIDDAELDTLRKGRALLDELLRSPKTKRTVERQIKALHPDTIISDDFDEPLRDEIKGIGKKLDEFLTAQKTSADDAKLESAFDALRRDGGYSDEGIEKIKQVMKERTIPDPMAAAALYEKMNPPPKPQQPSSFAGTSWGFGAKTEEPDAKLLFEDEDAFAEKEASKFFQEQAAKQ